MELSPRLLEAMGACERIVGGGEMLTYGAIMRELGISRTAAKNRVYKLMGLGLMRWAVVSEQRRKQKERRAVEMGSFVLGQVHLKCRERIDPADIEEVREEAFRAMGDGRREVDEPPMGLPCNNGKPRPKVTAKQACRKYLREWRKVKAGTLPAREPCQDDSTYRNPRDYRPHRCHSLGMHR